MRRKIKFKRPRHLHRKEDVFGFNLIPEKSRFDYFNIDFFKHIDRDESIRTQQGIIQYNGTPEWFDRREY